MGRRTRRSVIASTATKRSSCKVGTAHEAWLRAHRGPPCLAIGVRLVDLYPRIAEISTPWSLAPQTCGCSSLSPPGTHGMHMAPLPQAAPREKAESQTLATLEPDSHDTF